MDRKIDEWMDRKNRWMVGWIEKNDGWMVREITWMVAWIENKDGWMDNIYIYGWWVDGFIETKMDGWMDRKNRWMDG